MFEELMFLLQLATRGRLRCPVNRWAKSARWSALLTVCDKWRCKWFLSEVCIQASKYVLSQQNVSRVISPLIHWILEFPGFQKLRLSCLYEGEMQSSCHHFGFQRSQVWKLPVWATEAASAFRFHLIIFSRNTSGPGCCVWRRFLRHSCHVRNESFHTTKSWMTENLHRFIVSYNVRMLLYRQTYKLFCLRLPWWR